MKTKLNRAFRSMQGTVDDFVYRELDGQTIVGGRPGPRSTPPTAGQLAHRATFAKALVYARGAMTDPVRRPIYDRVAALKSVNRFALALGDYFKSPQVLAIDAKGYRGQIGDKIAVMAQDDIEVKGVTVVLRKADATILEQGPAALVHGMWTYIATAALPADTSLAIEVTAADWPGNTTTRTVVHNSTVPVVDSVDVSGYHGHVGDAIVTRAIDDVDVTGVTVTLRAANGAEIENGESTRVGDTWRFIATVAVPLGSTIHVLVEAADAQGNIGSKSLGVIVA